MQQKTYSFKVMQGTKVIKYFKTLSSFSTNIMYCTTALKINVK
jgi:hypothetical protein